MFKPSHALSSGWPVQCQRLICLLFVVAIGCSPSHEDPPNEPETATESPSEVSVVDEEPTETQEAPEPVVDQEVEMEPPEKVAAEPEPAPEARTARVPTIEELNLPDPPQMRRYEGPVTLSIAVSVPRGWQGRATFSAYRESGERISGSKTKQPPEKLGSADPNHEWLLYEVVLTPSKTYLTGRWELKGEGSEDWIVLAELSEGKTLRSGLTRVEWNDSPLHGLHRSLAIETTDARDWPTLVLPSDWRFKGTSPMVQYKRQKGELRFEGEVTDRIPLPPGSELIEHIQWNRFSTKNGSDWRDWSRGEPLRTVPPRPILTPPKFPPTKSSRYRMIPLLLVLQTPSRVGEIAVTAFQPDGTPVGFGTGRSSGRGNSAEEQWDWWPVELKMVQGIPWDAKVEEWVFTVDSVSFGTSIVSGLIPQLPPIQSPVFEPLRVVVPTQSTAELPSKAIQFEGDQAKWVLWRRSPMKKTFVFQSLGAATLDRIPELPFSQSTFVGFSAKDRQPIEIPFEEIEEAQRVTLEQGAYLVGSIPRDTPREGWSFRFQNHDGLDETHTTSRQGGISGMHLPTGPMTVTVSLRNVVVHSQTLDLSPGMQDLRELLPPFEEFARLVRIQITGTLEKPVSLVFEGDRRERGVLQKIGDTDKWEIFLWAPRKQPDSATIRYSNRHRLISAELDLSQDEILLTAPSGG